MSDRSTLAEAHDHKTRPQVRRGYRLDCNMYRCVAHAFTEKRAVCRRKRRCGWAAEWVEVDGRCVQSLSMDAHEWEKLRSERVLYV